MINELITYASAIDLLELTGLISGLLCVIFLIRESIYTWPFGILYVLVSFVIFWQANLYGDFVLHIFYLLLNIYGWYYWLRGKKGESNHVEIQVLGLQDKLKFALISAIGIIFFWFLLRNLHEWIEVIPPASLPFWDSTTSVLSITGIWLTARKKIDNWYYWFLVDVIATGVYLAKDLQFYALLYFIYIGLAISGYFAWRKTLLSYTSS